MIKNRAKFLTRPSGLVYPCGHTAKVLYEWRIRMIGFDLGKCLPAGLPVPGLPVRPVCLRPVPPYEFGLAGIPPGEGGAWQKPKQVLINAVWQAFISTLINPGLWGAPAGGNKHRRAGLLADKLQVDGVEAF